MRTPTAHQPRPSFPARSQTILCSLANFFAGDPDLKQVVSHTLEVGFRGTVPTTHTDRLTYNLGFYRSNLDDDIISSTASR